jgi:hypothetical protein
VRECIYTRQIAFVPSRFKSHKNNLEHGKKKRSPDEWKNSPVHVGNIADDHWNRDGIIQEKLRGY